MVFCVFSQLVSCGSDVLIKINALKYLDNVCNQAQFGCTNQAVTYWEVFEKVTKAGLSPKQKHPLLMAALLGD